VKTKAVIIEIVETFLVSLIVLVLINIFVGAVEQVWGSSMEPTFYTGERILVEKITKHFLSPKRGDVVIVASPQENNKHYIKRIIGLPGDILKIYDCKVFVLREGVRYQLEEAYLSSEECTVGSIAVKDGRSLRLKEDEYMILGDNRDNSIDSRVFGFLPKRAIIGRVVFRFWPLSRLSFVK
jgi:signal peptidase I